MKPVLKFPLNFGMNTLGILGGPSKPQIQHQPGQQSPLQLWQIVVTESREMVEFKVFVAATGEPLPEGQYEHLATVQLNGGGLVVHALALIE